MSAADLGGTHPARAPLPTVQNFLDFMQFFGKFDKIVCWCPPRGLVPPPTGNPGSAPVCGASGTNVKTVHNVHDGECWSLLVCESFRKR